MERKKRKRNDWYTIPAHKFMKYQYIKFVAVVSNVYYRYDMITSVHAELQTNRQYFLKRNYKSF